MSTKLVKSLREAIELSGLKSGMTVSFHHHLRNGDYVLNMVMDEIAAMGIRELTVNASALFDTHAPILEHVKNHVVRKILTNYMSAGIGRSISAGLMDEPVEYESDSVIKPNSELDHSTISSERRDRCIAMTEQA